MGEKITEVKDWLLASPFRVDPRHNINPDTEKAKKWPEWVAKGKEIAGIEATLLQMLANEPKPVLRSWAAQALGFVGGKSSVKVLIDVLASDVPLVQMEAAAALGHLNDPEAVEPLSKALQNADSNVRANASMSLGRLGGEKAGESLKQVLQDKDPFVQAAAKEALKRVCT